MTLRRAILEAIRARLLTIHQPAGFATDAGDTVLLNEEARLGADDPSVALVIVPGDEEPTWTGESVAVLWPIEIQVLAKADINEPWALIEDALGDVKRAIEVADRSFGGLVRTKFERLGARSYPREPGAMAVGIIQPYLVRYQESWGGAQSE